VTSKLLLLKLNFLINVIKHILTNDTAINMLSTASTCMRPFPKLEQMLQWARYATLREKKN